MLEDKEFSFPTRVKFAQCQKCLFIREYYFAENFDYEWESIERCGHCFADRKDIKEVKVTLK